MPGRNKRSHKFRLNHLLTVGGWHLANAFVKGFVGWLSGSGCDVHPTTRLKSTTGLVSVGALDVTSIPRPGSKNLRNSGFCSWACLCRGSGCAVHPATIFSIKRPGYHLSSGPQAGDQGAPKEHATGVERSAGVAWPQGIVHDADDDGHASEQARVDGEAARPRARNVWRPQRMKHARTDAVWLHEQEHRGEKRRKHEVEVYIMRPVVQIIQPQIAVATVAKLFSFLSAALASTGFFCYFGVASNSVVLILPGFIVLWIPRDHVTQYHLGVAAHVLRGRVLALHRVRAGDRRGGVREDHVVDDYREYTLCVQREPRCERAVVAADEELVLGVLDGADILAVLEYAEPGAGVEKEMVLLLLLTSPRACADDSPQILKKVTAEFCVGSTLKHPNIIATVDIVSDPAARPQARAQAQARRDHARLLGPRPAAGPSTCNSSETTSILSYTDRDSGSTSITDPPSRITTHSGGSAGALADELGSPRCLQIQNAQPVFKNTVTLPVMGLLTTDSPTEAEMDRNSTELLPLSPREPYTDLTFPSTPSSHTDDLPTPRVGTMPLAVPMSPPRTRVATFNAFHTVHVKQAAD
ncbi:hypothetical protein B0H13DRAFT_1887143 [Mycena leptocephala]|nr:hypothetical protein B0H13DRAFT_1887143 [Mycena leptocephala]